MLAQKNEYIASAYEQLQVISQDKQKRLAYEERQKAIWDHNQMIYEAEQRGEQRGREQGEKLGREQGEIVGREQGEKLGREQGEKRVNKLNEFLMDEDRVEDLKRSLKDKDYQEQLMKQYGI